MSYKKTICVDFDGVIHWYRNGWQNGKIYDEPVPGSIEWLVRLAKNPDFEVAIYSSRSKDPELLHKMKYWISLELLATMMIVLHRKSVSIPLALL